METLIFFFDIIYGTKRKGKPGESRRRKAMGLKVKPPTIARLPKVESGIPAAGKTPAVFVLKTNERSNEKI